MPRTIKLNIHTIIYSILLLTISSALGQNTNFLDLDFNSTGSGYFPPIGSRSEFYDQKILEDGSIIIAGTTEPQTWNFDFVALKIKPEGVIDSTFGENGYALVNFETGDSDDRCRAIEMLPNGKILLAGYLSSTSTQSLITRLNADGSADTTFGDNGKIILEHGWPPITGFITSNELEILADGKFYIAGTNNSSNVMLNLYNEDGTLDTAFGSQGYGLIDVNEGIDEEEVQLVLQTDGRIIIVGRVDNKNFAVRFNTNGQIDSSYGQNGVAWVDMAYSASGELASAALQSNGKLIIAGTQETGSFFTHQMASARLNIDGSLDTSYGNNGYHEVPVKSPKNASWGAGEAHSILIDETDRIFLGGKMKNGNWWRFGIMSLSPDGHLDTTFADNGFAYTNGSEKKITSMRWDGTKIVAAGNFYVARFLTQNTTAIGQETHTNQIYSFNLEQNYPNPFNPETTINYQLSKPGKVSLNIYNVLGKKVKTIINKHQKNGHYSVRFNAKDFPSGIYFYRLSTNDKSISKRMLLLR
ncbi:MAG: T9SS type A sorting domain-containing protein [Calditrichaeota bacterium]|nr:T9SS type A sorting domain-containing protein [Calditrichota bacterium]